MQIEALFQAGVPDFDTVDNVGAGKGWPRLRTLLGVGSAAEILVAFLSPTAAQGLALDEDASWQAIRAVVTTLDRLLEYGQ